MAFIQPYKKKNWEQVAIFQEGKIMKIVKGTLIKMLDIHSALKLPTIRQFLITRNKSFFVKTYRKTLHLSHPRCEEEKEIEELLLFFHTWTRHLSLGKIIYLLI